MIERLALVFVLALVGYGAFYLFRLTQMRRMSQAHQPHTQQIYPAAAATAVSTPEAMPTLLYFRADSCAVCPAQSRQLDQLTALWDGQLDIRTIDAERDPEMAGRYGVLSLPTTVVVDPQGQVRQINYGLTDARKLARQLETLAA